MAGGGGGAAEDLTSLVDLACADVGGCVLYANNEWFAEASNLLKPGRATFDPNTYSMTGKVMDGWETGRHGALDPERNGHDFCIIRLGIPGLIHGVDVDTLHFTGNFAQSAMVEACTAPVEAPWFDLHRTAQWFPIILRTGLVSGAPGLGHNVIHVVDGESTDAQHRRRRFTHVRLSIFPDGGVARFRVFGTPSPDWTYLRSLGVAIDLASVQNGGHAVDSSNKFYSHPSNLLLPTRAANMGSGWESQRSRKADNQDWAIIQLGQPGVVHAIEVDTAHFRGNFPHRIRVDATTDASGQTPTWKTLVSERPGRGHFRAVFFADDLSEEFRDTPITHVRVVSIPDGGISRLRVYCRKF
ncbi:Allantoicase domain-containing protein [Plasmodiophora brassicae]